ncbi:MAG: flagellar hook-length control protein FliK, partial [Cellvibrio sp.]
LQTKIDASGPGKNNAALTNSILEASSKPAITNTALYNAKDLALKFSSTPDNKSISPETAAAKTLVSENLRNLLPHRDTPNVLFSAIAQLRQFPPTSRLQLFSPSVEQALKSVAEKMRAPDTLSQPKALAHALKNSGVFFEHKLNQLAQSSIVSSGDAAKFSGTLHNTYHQDLKGSLLTLLNRVTQDITGDKRPITNEQTQKILQQVTSAPLFSTSLSAFALNSKHDLSQAIGVFIQQLMQKPVKELSNKELRTQLLTLLQQHSVHSLARIQLQQLHAINHELDNKDSTTPTASWQLEIPVKHQNDVHHLHMRIDREWVDDKNESKSNTEKNNNKIKQWSVTLRFDLPTLGEFCAQLAIVNTQVSATLWAAQEKTFTQVRDQIEGLRKQLESEGMSVKYLQCMRGIPPEKPMSLSYSLIDIST